MKPGFSAITKTKFYHPAFNSAIFDGPIRIYFVQFHESYALNIYFLFQDFFKEKLNDYKEMGKKIDQTVLIMIYPTEDGFLKAFGPDELLSKSFAKSVTTDKLVFGLLAPLVESHVGQLMEELSDIFKEWDRQTLAEVVDHRASRAVLVGDPEAVL